MKRQVMIMAAMTFVLASSRLTGWAANDPRVADPKTEAEIKAVNTQLMSGDPQQVQEAIGAIQQFIAKDPRAGIMALTKRWNTPLFFAKRFDDIISLAQTGVILAQNPAFVFQNDNQAELLLQMQIRALMAAGRGMEALAVAKSLYNYVSMRNTSVAIDLVGQALTAAHKDQPGLGKKFRLQQMEGPSTNAIPDAIAKTPSMLADVKVDAKPYEPAIAGQLKVDNVTLGTLKTLANLYLLADQPKKAEELFRRIYEMADQANLSAAIEGIARSYRAQDGNIARANAYIIAERNKTQ